MTSREVGQMAITTLLVLVALTVGANSALNLYSARKRVEGSAEHQVRQLRGERLAAFEAINIRGTRIQLPVQERPTLLYFFSTTCGACILNRDRWDALAHSISGSGRAVVAAISFEAADTLRRYVRSDTEALWIVYPDESEQLDVQQGFRMWATPTLYVFDSTGVLRYSHVGIFGTSTERDARRALGDQQ